MLTWPGPPRKASDAPNQDAQSPDEQPVTDVAQDPVIPDFEALYGAESDPWKVRSSFYEQRKLDIVLASLGRPFYRSAWDPACGVGELALRLAGRCTAVLATDLAASAVRITGQRCEHESGVTTAQLALPAAPNTPARFDLVVLSEFMYYLDAEARPAALTLIDAVAADDAEVVAVHWRHHPHDGWLSGVEVEDETVQFLRDRGWSPTVHHDDTGFVLDVLRREESHS